MAPRNPRFMKKFPNVDETLKISIQNQIDEFLRDGNQNTLVFPTTLDNTQRAYIHNYVVHKGLISKSFGKDANRQLVLTKVSDINPDVECITTFSMTPTERRLCNTFLNKHPLRADEIEELHYFTGISNRQSVPVSLTCGLNRHHQFSVPPTRNNPTLRACREKLPIFSYREHIIETIASNQVIVVSGDTGSGKTTQVPQFLLEQHAKLGRECRIICTQPRRLAAISISERVAQERGEKLGETIGYQIRLESCVSTKSNLIYTTSGYLLRCLISGTQRELFRTITHVILDEVHERDKFTDFLLIAIKEALHDNPQLKVVLMSATIDSDVFTQYFNGCPIVDIPGRMFPVELHNLESTLGLIGYTDNKVVYFDETMSPTMTEAAQYATSIQKAEKPQVPAEEVHVDKDTQDFVNEVLEECFKSEREDSFSQFYYLVSGESVPVDIKHSQTQMTALMVAATKGYLGAVKTLICLGANPKIIGAYDMNACQWANRMNHTDCVSYLTSISNPEPPAAPSTSPYLQKLLESYQAKQSDEEIDLVLLCEIIKHIHTNMSQGSILVFMPGYDSIVELNDFLNGYITSNKLESNLTIFMLHGSMQPKDQKRVFAPPPRNHRKIILSTNISETSLTIDDVVYVIDTGKVKQKTFDAITGATSLTPTWISQACAKQRMGRAGRVRPGVCFRVYSQLRFDSMDKFTLPEILRIPLTELSLNAKIISGHSSIADFLLKAIHPPPTPSVVQSIRLLKRIGALDEQENVTELGTLLVDLPVDVQLGKALLLSILLKCLDPVLTIISVLSVKDPFILPGLDSDQLASKSRRSFAYESLSDHMVLLKVYQEWNESHAKKYDRQFCRENFINNNNMHMVTATRAQILSHLRSVGLVHNRSKTGNIQELNQHSDNWAMVKACLTAGLYPNVCRVDRAAGQLKSRMDDKLVPHKSSVLRDKNSKKGQDSLKSLPTEWILFGEKSKAGRMSMVRHNTLVSPLNIALFAGPIYLPESNLVPVSEDLNAERRDDPFDSKTVSRMTKLIVDDWITFDLTTEDAYCVHHMRQKFNAMFVKMVRNPSKFNPDSMCINTLANMLQTADKSCNLTQPDDVGLGPVGLKLRSGPNFKSQDVDDAQANESSHRKKFYGKEVFAPSRSQASNFEYRTQRRPVMSAASVSSSSLQLPGPSRVPKVRTPGAPNHPNPPAIVKTEINTSTARFFVIHADSEQQIIEHLRSPLKWFWSKEILDQVATTSYRFPNIEVLLFFFIPMQQRFFGVGLFRTNPQFQSYQTDALSLKSVQAERLRQIWFKPANGRQTTTFDQSEDGEEIIDRMAAKMLLDMLM